MNIHSCTRQVMLRNNVRALQVPCLAFLLIGFLLLLNGVATAQTEAERDNFVSVLNAALVSISSQIGADPNLAYSVPIAIPGSITVKGYDGVCSAPTNASLRYDPAETDIITLVTTLRGATTMDIPEYSHDMVCQLNNMWWHFINGNYQTNWTLDQAQSPVIADLNFDVNCVAFTSQKFWMIDEDQYYPLGALIPPAEIMDPGQPALMWQPVSTFVGRLNDIDPLPATETNGSIYGTDFVDADNSGKNVWVVRRHDDNDGRFEIRRGFTRLNFDYDYHDGGSGGTPSTNYDYIDPFADISWGYTKKLTGMELVAQTHVYNPDDCPQTANLNAIPQSTEANWTLTLHYVDGAGTPGTVVCSNLWDSGPIDDDNQDLWERLNGNLSKTWGEFGIDENGVLFFETTSTCGWTSEKLGLVKLRSRDVPADSCKMALGIGGLFSLDERTGAVISTATIGGKSVVDQIFCFDFCDPWSGYLTFDNVISASAQTYVDSWSYDPSSHGVWDEGYFGEVSPPPPGSGYDPYTGVPDNQFQRSERGKWRPEKMWGYRTNIKSGVGGNLVHGDAGVFVDNAGSPTGAFQLFMWHDPASNRDNWLNPVTITEYAPSGEVLEEHDIVDIYGTAKLAHNETVPRLMARNATYDAVDFQSFEEYTPTPGGPYTDEYAHSGEVSYRLIDAGAFSDTLASVILTDQIDQEGLLLKFWVKQTYTVFETTPGFSNPPMIIKVGNQVFSTLSLPNYNTLDPNTIHKVAQTGEWSLYQLVVDAFGSAIVGDQLPVRIKNNLAAYGDAVWIDDVRIQPLDAGMTCFVYDRHTLRLIGQFDDQHFGVYSRYNGEGNVVSVLRETERGLVTVSESQSWTLTQSRYVGPGGSTIGGPTPSYPFRNNLPERSLSGRASGGRGADFDIAGLHIGPDGPMVNLFGGDEMPLDQLQELLDFSSDFPNIDTETLLILLQMFLM